MSVGFCVNSIHCLAHVVDGEQGDLHGLMNQRLMSNVDSRSAPKTLLSPNAVRQNLDRKFCLKQPKSNSELSRAVRIGLRNEH
jgi:hypothetical protein